MTDMDMTKITDDNLKKVREHFDAELPDNITARYLRARDNNVAETITQINRVRHWRSMNPPITKEEILKELAKGYVYPRGFDNDGNPIIVAKSSKLPGKGDRNLKDAVRMCVYVLDYVICKVMPSNKTKFTLLIDRADAKDPDMDLARGITGLIKDLYAERLKKVILHPTNVLLYSLVAIIKVFMDPASRDKIQCIMYQSALPDQIPKEYIPKAIGGDDEYVFSVNDITAPSDWATICTIPSEKDQAASDAANAKPFNGDDFCCMENVSKDPSSKSVFC